VSDPSKLLKRFPKRASVAGNPGVAASSETVPPSGTATAEHDPCECAQCADAAPVAETEKQNCCKASC